MVWQGVRKRAKSSVRFLGFLSAGELGSGVMDRGVRGGGFQSRCAEEGEDGEGGGLVEEGEEVAC